MSRARRSLLSPAKRNALVACFNAGGLHKKDGAWHGSPGGKPVSGMTTADLARDGMLTVTTNHQFGSAQLTERGNWFARTLLCQGTTANSESVRKLLPFSTTTGNLRNRRKRRSQVCDGGGWLRSQQLEETMAYAKVRAMGGFKTQKLFSRFPPPSAPWH